MLKTCPVAIVSSPALLKIDVVVNSVLVTVYIDINSVLVTVAIVSSPVLEKPDHFVHFELLYILLLSSVSYRGYCNKVSASYVLVVTP